MDSLAALTYWQVARTSMCSSILSAQRRVLTYPPAGENSVSVVSVLASSHGATCNTFAVGSAKKGGNDHAFPSCPCLSAAMMLHSSLAWRSPNGPWNPASASGRTSCPGMGGLPRGGSAALNRRRTPARRGETGIRGFGANTRWRAGSGLGAGASPEPRRARCAPSPH